jgi:hypothetical protein
MLVQGLDQAVDHGLLMREGGGYRTSPFRYWIPGRDQEWANDPAHQLRELTWRDGEALADLTRRAAAVSP